MTSTSEHAQTLLAAIVPDGREPLERARRHLTAEHFTDRVHAVLWTLLERYHELTGGVLTREAIGQALRGQRVDAGTLLHYEETYDLLSGLQVDEAGFLWAVEQLRDLAAERATREAYTEAMQILTHGSEDDRGQPIQGHVASRARVLTRIVEIDRQQSIQAAPEGDMRDEGDELLAEYAKTKADRLEGRGQGIRFGIPQLDAKVDGLNNGELVLLVGYASEGKTSLAVQLAWDAAVNQGRNVVVLTTETIRKQVRRRIISRHSCLPLFDIPNGLNSRDLKQGSLTPAQELKYQQVVRDWQGNPTYGRFYICQIPNGAAISYIESKLLRIQRMFPIDLVIMDYLALLKPERRRNSTWEEQSNTLKEAKQLAVTFNDGLGVPFVSPWQVSRQARMEAERTGSFNMSALADTTEAEKSADTIISILAPLDNEKRFARVKMQGLKVRDGERCNGIEVDVDYATSRFYLREVGAGRGSVEDLFAGDPFAGLGV